MKVFTQHFALYQILLVQVLKVHRLNANNSISSEVLNITDFGICMGPGINSPWISGILYNSTNESKTELIDKFKIDLVEKLAKFKFLKIQF